MPFLMIKALGGKGEKRLISTMTAEQGKSKTSVRKKMKAKQNQDSLTLTNAKAVGKN